MGDRIASSKALGFSAFAIAAWMFSMSNAGWYTANSGGSTVAAVMAFATLALLIAGLVAFLRGDTWHAVFFIFWTAVTWGERATMGMSTMGSSSYGAWYAIAVALVSLFLFMAASRTAQGTPVALLSLGITLVFLANALGGWLGGSAWTIIAGYLGLLTGLASFWAAWNAFAELGGGGGGGAMPHTS